MNDNEIQVDPQLHRLANMVDQARAEIRRLDQLGLRGSEEYAEAKADYYQAINSMVPVWPPVPPVPPKPDRVSTLDKLLIAALGGLPDAGPAAKIRDMTVLPALAAEIRRTSKRLFGRKIVRISIGAKNFDDGVPAALVTIWERRTF